jgi:hypothetical protein
MAEKELNIKSSTIEKGLELAKEFLGKLVTPTLEEAGLLLADKIRSLRYKSQVNILLKAKSYVEKKGISAKEIPLKILCPLLEGASLEEEAGMQDKWAIMLANLADSEKNFQNHIFPFILSQISIEEFNGLVEMRKKESEHSTGCSRMLELEKNQGADFSKSNPELTKLREAVLKYKQEGANVGLKDFQYSNLERLGLIAKLPPRVLIEEFQTGGMESVIREQWHSLETYYDADSGFRINELGAKFLEICEID